MDALLRCLLQQMRRFVGEAVHRRRGLGRQQQVGGRLHGGIPPDGPVWAPFPEEKPCEGSGPPLLPPVSYPPFTPL